MWGFTHDVLPTPVGIGGRVRRRVDRCIGGAALASLSASFPHIVRMALTAPGAAGGCDADAEFRFALDILLEAFEQRRLSGWSSTEGR